MGYYLLECKYCGSEFDATRTDAKFCSPSCRTMNYRRKVIERERMWQMQQENERALKAFRKSNQIIFDAYKKALDIFRKTGSWEEGNKIIKKATLRSDAIMKKR